MTGKNTSVSRTSVSTTSRARKGNGWFSLEPVRKPSLTPSRRQKQTHRRGDRGYDATPAGTSSPSRPHLALPHFKNKTRLLPKTLLTRRGKEDLQDTRAKLQQWADSTPPRGKVSGVHAHASTRNSKERRSDQTCEHRTNNQHVKTALLVTLNQRER